VPTDAGVERPGLAFSSWLETVAVGGLLTPIVANCPDVAMALAELERFHPLVGRQEVVLLRRPGSITLTLPRTRLSLCSRRTRLRRCRSG